MHSSNSFAKNLNGHISHVPFTKSLPILDEALYQFVTFCTVICRIWLVGLWKSLYIFRPAWSLNRVTEGRLNLGQIYVTWRFKTKSQWTTITVKILVPHINSVTTRVWNKHNWDNTILWKFTKHAQKLEWSDYINCFSTFLVTIRSHSFCSCLLQCQLQVAPTWLHTVKRRIQSNHATRGSETIMVVVKTVSRHRENMVMYIALFILGKGMNGGSELEERKQL